jgi:hypothetical protein
MIDGIGERHEMWVDNRAFVYGLCGFLGFIVLFVGFIIISTH